MPWIKITIKNNYHLPCIDDLLDSFNGVKYFSWIDLKLGYYQIHITDEDRKNNNEDQIWFLQVHGDVPLRYVMFRWHSWLL
jgi:hypothetical protein